MTDQQYDAIVDDLGQLVKQLVRDLRKAAPGNDLAEKAMDYLKRHGLQGSPLRVAPATVAAPVGWSITRKADGSISVRSPDGEAWNYRDASGTGTDSAFIHKMLSAIIAAPALEAPAAPVSTYVEVRECSDCGHVGINDTDGSKAACNTCDWQGDSPREDKCPGCNRVGTMSTACPKCGFRTSLLAETHLLAAAPQAPAAPFEHSALLLAAQAAYEHLSTKVSVSDANYRVVTGLAEAIADVLDGMAAPAAPVADEREAFEAFIRKDTSGFSLNRDGESYEEFEVATYWHFWKARAALAVAQTALQWMLKSVILRSLRHGKHCARRTISRDITASEAAEVKAALIAAQAAAKGE